MSIHYFVLLALVIAVAASSPCIDQVGSVVGMAGRHLPRCDEDGYYAAKQCQEARCFCVDKLGNRLTDLFHVARYGDTDCKCAREKSNLNHMIGRILSCDEIGNYSPHQCTGSACYCVDPKGGKQLTATVHISKINELNC